MMMGVAMIMAMFLLIGTYALNMVVVALLRVPLFMFIAYDLYPILAELTIHVARAFFRIN